MIQKIKKFVRYLLSKKSEVTQLGPDDIYMGKVIFGDIYAHNPKVIHRLLPLSVLYPIHPLDRANSQKSVTKRATLLKRHQVEILKHGSLDTKLLEKYMPSVSGLRAVKVDEQTYFVFEGNGRLAAIKEVFPRHQTLKISVEEYLIQNPTQVIEGLQNIRKANGLD